MAFRIDDSFNPGSILGAIKLPDSTGPQLEQARAQALKNENALAPLRQQEMQADLTTKNLANQQTQIGLQEAQIIQQAFRNPKYRKSDGTFDYSGALSDLQGQVRPSTLQGMQTFIDTHAKNAADTSKLVQEAEDLKRKGEAQDRQYHSDLFAGLLDNYTPQNVMATLAGLPPRYAKEAPALWQQYQADPDAFKQEIGNLITPETKDRLAKLAQTKASTAETNQKVITGNLDLAARTVPDNPEDWAKWYAGLDDETKRRVPANYSAAAADKVRRMGVSVEKQPEWDLNSYKAKMGLVGNTEYDQFLVQYAKSLGKTPAQLTPEEGLASFGAYAEKKQDPQMRAAALAQKNLSDVLKQIQIDQQPTKDQASLLADDIVNHRLAPDQISQIRGRGNGSLGLMVYEAAKKKDPNFNWEEASSEYTLAKSPQFQQTVRYMDYVGSSVDRVISAADKLDNGKIRSLNAVKNWAADQLNGVDIAKFQTDRIEVADAIAKILQGGGSGSGTSDMKLKQAEELIRTTDSPAVVRAKMQEIKELIGTRRSTLTRGTFLEKAQSTSVPGAATIRVRRKSDGATGTLDPKDFDPNKYEKM